MEDETELALVRIPDESCLPRRSDKHLLFLDSSSNGWLKRTSWQLE